MATLERIQFQPQTPDVRHAEGPAGSAPGINPIKLPVIVWASGDTWGVANLWAHHLLQSLDLKTVETSMKHLAAYAQWLELEAIDWWHFPETKEKRCLYAFRRALIAARTDGEIAPSTASARMSAVQRFYAWANAAQLINPGVSMWETREVSVKTITTFGLERTMKVLTSDLTIPNRKVKGGFYLEDGVMPVTEEGRRDIQEFSEVQPNEELKLMLALGFGTGLRIGSIIDLKVITVEQAAIDPFTGWRCMDVGPAARPPVATKLGMNGKVPFVAEDLRARVREYAASPRRLMRQAKAAPKHRGLLFLNKYGTPYTQGAVTTEMSRLRTKAIAADVHAFRDFYFHRSRATFATMLMRAALKSLRIGDAIDLVREACLHANAETTMQYVKFIEQSKAMRENADAFTDAFLGLSKREISRA